ncbi:MAG: efflux RND transporter periplasmic adaptor subunit [Pseudomonadota bacterium]
MQRKRTASGWRYATAAVLSISVLGCVPEEEDETLLQPPVRGLITVVVEDAVETTVRRYPSVLEPGEVNVLSFEVGGRLGRLDLSVGQRIDAGSVLAELDGAQFVTTIENRRARIEELTATLEQAEDDLARSETLLARGVATRVQRDEDATEVREIRAQLLQAEKDLAEAVEDLQDTELIAPFDGIISAVEVDSFATVSAGEAVVSVYEASDYEVSFSVSFDVVSRLVVGTPATVRLADDPSVALDAVVSELGERADTVSSFPVVVSLTETVPVIKAGMSVEVAFEFALPEAQGFRLPTSAAIPEGQIPESPSPDRPQPVPVFVYDPETSTVTRRMATFAGLRGNDLLIIDGLEPGERVAVKGVSFLREGMPVKLIEDME